jgi:hypothetical protein
VNIVFDRLIKDGAILRQPYLEASSGAKATMVKA